MTMLIQIQKGWSIPWLICSGLIWNWKRKKINSRIRIGNYSKKLNCNIKNKETKQKHVVRLIRNQYRNLLWRRTKARIIHQPKSHWVNLERCVRRVAKLLKMVKLALEIKDLVGKKNILLRNMNQDC